MQASAKPQIAMFQVWIDCSHPNLIRCVIHPYMHPPPPQTSTDVDWKCALLHLLDGQNSKIIEDLGLQTNSRISGFIQKLAIQSMFRSCSVQTLL